MTREEAINHIKYGLIEGNYPLPKEIGIEALNLAIKALEQEQKTEWIPVSERLPEDGKTVIASVKGCVYPEARYVKGYGWEWAYESGADYWESLDDVIAWQPLPKPYQIKFEL